MQILVQQSHDRVQHLSHMLSSTLYLNFSEYSVLDNTTLMPVIKRIPTSHMLVEVGIGTFNNDSYKSYLLVMDTGSKFIWT
ncbi:putative Peptidase family A1 domain-containing protein [Lupinus albus]|uniref:Putative Peptidase family A1 domain-containing protein n=1 Tax=Lupinus albus TaxID=3870 RepID=A0A6A4R6H9_LUPAL|nr:putative Peptidase family A1 domain-containing protein [Lupinus albus]